MAQNLELSFEIEGEKQLMRTLQGVSQDMKDWTPEFKRTGNNLKRTFFENFDSEGGDLDQPWAPLAPSTVAEKERLGYGGKGILVRTGDLKKGFRSRAEKLQVTVDNPVEYFKYHQSNKPRSRLPRRVMMALTRKKREEIVKIFQKSIEKTLQNR